MFEFKNERYISSYLSSPSSSLYNVVADDDIEHDLHMYAESSKAARLICEGKQLLPLNSFEK
jgi:hypothetical protein